MAPPARNANFHCVETFVNNLITQVSVNTDKNRFRSVSETH